MKYCLRTGLCDPEDFCSAFRDMSTFSVKPLDATTWEAFARLVERHNGVWGGCWCMEFHPEGNVRGSDRRQKKECRVRENRAHAALVFQGEDCLGWCQFGSPGELSRIKHLRNYSAGLIKLPDWRITCFFVDRAHRGEGVAEAALVGALNEIARLGGGVVESYPEEVGSRKVSSSFLHNSSISLFERHGFQRVRQIGKSHWVVAKSVPAKLLGDSQ